MSLAKLRMESPEKMSALVDQLRNSKVQKELSVDILDYMCDATNQIDSAWFRPHSVSRISVKLLRTSAVSAWTVYNLFLVGVFRIVLTSFL